MTTLPSSQKSANKSSAAPTPGSSHMDAATAAYVQQHDLAFLLQTMDKVLRDVEDEMAPPPPAFASAQANARLSPSPLVSQESAATRSSPVSEGGDRFQKENGLPPTSAPTEKPLQTTLMLQLLLSSFVPLSIPGALAGLPNKNGGGAQYPSPSPPSPPPLAETQRDVSESAAVQPVVLSPASPSSPFPWPSNITFASKEAAVKAELCHSFAQQCERLRTGRGLLDSCGPDLRWSDVCPASGGHERLGVALALDVFRCWRRVLVPLLRSTGDLLAPDDAAGQDAAVVFFDTLVLPVSLGAAAKATSNTPTDVVALCSYWCYTLLQGYCRDISATLWTSILQAAQRAAIAQLQVGAGKKTRSSTTAALEGENLECASPPLSCEALLLRSFLFHLACPPSVPSSGCDAEDAANAFLSTAEAAAKLRSPAWVWSEVEELQAEMHAESAFVDATTTSAVLCADGYWAVFLQPYRAMYAQYGV